MLISKKHYWEPGDLTEAPLGGFVVDLLRTQKNPKHHYRNPNNGFRLNEKKTQCSTRYLQQSLSSIRSQYIQRY
ncbi:MAG: hypothetical protein Ct9H90mP5_06280 [Acidimicrobiaceae bacterium]|nr:MAG: hypothetical protein Ct9H90mP5_06280 [Acidimicrobiaceae bacterium]